MLSLFGREAFRALSRNTLRSALSVLGITIGIAAVICVVAIGKAGATNAGILAAQILAAADSQLAEKLAAHKQKLARGVEEKSKKLKGKL